MTIRRLTTQLLAIDILLIIYSLVSIFLGITYQSFFTPLITILAFFFAILHGSQSLGWKRTIVLLLLTFTVSLLFESVGVATGWVYGPYHYTDELGPKFLGLVPWLIPIAWFMMTYPSYVIATRLVSGRSRAWVWRLFIAAIGAVIMTAWDLAMDPMMVAGGHWVWEQPGAYFGVPLQNYWGWWLTTFITFWFFVTIARVSPEQASRDDSFTSLATWSYIAIGLSCVLTDFEIGLPGPALVGIFSMLPWVVMGLLTKRE